MLSAIVQRLQEIRRASGDRRSITIELCAAAYPDVRPWQVDRQCRGPPPPDTNLSKALKDLYYNYLSMLLHPHDGNDAARHDVTLVKEWCELSVIPVGEDNEKSPSDRPGTGHADPKRKNFLSVASRASSDHLVYVRDLPFLLELSMQMDDLDLSLDLSEFMTVPFSLSTALCVNHTDKPMLFV